ncbi:DUF300 domain protein [Cordyceps fumosorosea ARSEF 2679]|uniref:DUF300 domain protein n=1 Tax=Cordyceps fumosorosea (strain ARSEF 2679) TaxID=1081104 RepID=A0A167V8M7_CORFA|nr:DUF300 domain protein [Cordyceps fumosorosea ARSEF 2679]OAA62345.1 DUF300 domain protein [Cordyceps fumosorosea ARSEF 2679]
MDTQIYATSNGGTGAKFKGYTTVIAGVASIIATIVSVLSIWLQAKNYRKPLLQRYVVRILLMVPIYSIASWTSMVSLTAAQFVDPIRDIYEAFTIYTFFQLLINYLGGERSLIVMTHGRAPVQHLWPMDHVLAKVDISDPYTFLSIKRGILQYAWLKPILAIAAIIMKATGTYQEGYIGATSGYFWSGIIYNISVTVSLYSLGLFWVCMHQDLKPFRPVPKFLSIKLIIFASYWQGFFLSILVWLGAIPDDVQGYTRDNLAAAIQDFLICLEMPIFAVVHWYAFSWYDFADNSILSARMPLTRALRDAFGPKDLIEDSKETFKGDKYVYRKFDSGDKVMAHADSRSRFARLDEGMRYERGGKGKYWLPKPGKTSSSPLLDNGEGGSSNQDSQRDSSMGTFDEPEIDPDEERMYEQARQLEYGDWNYPVITANEPLRERYGSSFSSRGVYSPAPRLGTPQRRSPASTAQPSSPKAQAGPQEPPVIAVRKKKKPKKVIVKHQGPEAEALLADTDFAVESGATQAHDGAASSSAIVAHQDTAVTAEDHNEDHDENNGPKLNIHDSEEFRNVWGRGN